METGIEQVRSSFEWMQSQKTDENALAIKLSKVAEMFSYNWERKIFTVEELWNLNPQLYVGLFCNDDNKLDGDSGHLTYRLWQKTEDSQAQEMVKALTNFRNNPETDNLQIENDLKKMNDDMLRNTILSKNPEKYPLILLNNNGILPYTTGQTVDGVRRSLTLLETFKKGDIQGSTPIHTYIGQIDNIDAIAYNTVAFLLNKRPLKEKLRLYKERITIL